ncbi:MAG: hypothetical protein J5U17_00900 [Candidatus Methanoperedens sp.]|nr:hypothetical protein [Candidatus Methanoperedens sp.]MCE8424319.1 hypothetical protein [Candidatus Methanoperedens sp.]MCE8427652.1 hypothetical protein [Candidatus Methanoperedens sp.]
MHLKIEPIGVIKKSTAGLFDVLIYSDFEPILTNIMEKFTHGANLLIVHKNDSTSDEHQVHVSEAEIINRKGNLLTVKGIEADNDSVIDIRLGNML